MKAYVIQALVEGRQVPTFYLLANVQGIVSEGHASEIAKDILGLHDPSIRYEIAVEEVTL